MTGWVPRRCGAIQSRLQPEVQLIRPASQGASLGLASRNDVEPGADHPGILSGFLLLLWDPTMGSQQLPVPSLFLLCYFTFAEII